MLPSALDAQFETPYPRSAGFDTDIGAFIESSSMTSWYVSNVSIIFDCSMLHYLLFWTILGFIFHFYIIFGTNLLTGGPAQNCYFFCLFQSFAEKEYQTESKRNETFRNVIFSPNMIQETWSASKKQSRVPRDSWAHPGGRTLHPRDRVWNFLE